MMRQRIFLIFMPVLAAILAGCVSVDKSYPEKRYFTLDASRPESASPPQDTGPVLRIRRFKVSPRYESKRFVYRRDDLSYTPDFYNEFLVSPDAMITDEVAKWLRGTGVFQHVTDSPSHVSPDYLLEGAVTVLHGDFRDANAPRAVMEMQLSLLRSAKGELGIAFHQTYREEIPLADMSPTALARGWNEAFGKILRDFENDLTGLDFSDK